MSGSSTGYPFTVIIGIICRFTDGIEGDTLLDLNDLLNYWLLDDSEFPLPDVVYSWVENSEGRRLADWHLLGDKLKLVLLIHGDSEDDAYTKLRVLLKRLLKENTLEVRPYGAVGSVFYHTYPAMPMLPQWNMKAAIETGYITNVTIEIPVDTECQVSPEIIPVLDNAGLNDSFEDATDGWVDTVSGGTITQDAANYITGSAGCKFTTTNVAHTTKRESAEYQFIDATHHYGVQCFGYKVSGTVTFDLGIQCYDDDDHWVGNVRPLINVNPTVTSWRDLPEVYGYPIIYPTGSASPAWPEGTVKVKRDMRHDTTVGVITIDDCLLVDTEYISDHKLSSAFGVVVPPDTVLGDVPSEMDIYIKNAFTPGPWGKQTSGETVDIHGVHALDSAHGYACSDGGYIFFYDGVYWATQASGVSVPLYGISAFDSTHKWAVGSSGTIRFSNGVWSGQTYPVPAPACSNQKFDAWDDNYTLTGWSKVTYAGNLLKRSDSAPDLWLEFTSNGSAYFLVGTWAATPVAFDPSCSYNIGVWEKCDNIGNRGAAAAQIDVYFCDVYNNQLGTAHKTPLNMYSDWTAVSFDITPADYPAGTAKISVGLSVGGQALYDANPAHAFTIMFNDMSITPNGYPHLYGAHAISANDIVAVGQYGCIISTADGGTTWVRRDSKIWENLNAVHYIAGIWYAVGDNGTILTSPDGTTWTVRTSGTIKDLYGVYALDATHIWVVGEDGTILFSADAGVNWTPWISNTTKTLKSIYAFDTTNAWAVGDDGTLLFFNGTVWTSQGSGTSENLNGVSGISATKVWAVGDEGIILSGLYTVSNMPMDSLVVGQRKEYSEDFNPVLEAEGATQTTLYTRRGQRYRAMAAGTTEEFLFNLASHKGKCLVSLDACVSAGTVDQVLLTFQLKTTGGTVITSQSIIETIDLSVASGSTAIQYFREIVMLAERFAEKNLPTHYVSKEANDANINESILVTAGALGGDFLWIGSLKLIYIDQSWVAIDPVNDNSLILESKTGLVYSSLDGTFDTAMIKDGTTWTPSFTFMASPDGMNLTFLAANKTGSGATTDYQMTPCFNVYLKYYPKYLLVKS